MNKLIILLIFIAGCGPKTTATNEPDIPSTKSSSVVETKTKCEQAPKCECEPAQKDESHSNAHYDSNSDNDNDERPMSEYEQLKECVVSLDQAKEFIEWKERVGQEVDEQTGRLMNEIEALKMENAALRVQLGLR